MNTAAKPLCRLLLLILPSVLLAVPAAAEDGAPADSPLALAVIRIPSHGCSGTVIFTEPGRSLILSCAHAFQGADRSKPIKLDGPIQPQALPGRHAVRLVRVDYERDLTLIEHDNGPYYCVPVAPAGYRPSGPLVSVGYDGMNWPVTQRTATALFTTRTTTWTREQPWEGRSGGALFDSKGGYLIGVVQAYEVGGQRRGLYVSLATIREFLWPTTARTPPQLPHSPPIGPSCPPPG